MEKYDEFTEFRQRINKKIFDQENIGKS